MKNKSEVKFVEWSKGIKPGAYDIIAATRILQGLKKNKLRGLDVGGGIGVYASFLSTSVGNCEMTVVDNSDLVPDAFVDDNNCILVKKDFFSFETEEKFDFVIFKTVLHHFICADDASTREMHIKGLLKAKSLLTPDGIIIVEENFYESAFGKDVTARIIYEITKLKFIEKIVRALGANTAGEGVRFRSTAAWNELFSEAGLRVKYFERSPTWGRKWPIWQRIPLLCKEGFQAILELVPV